MIFAVALEHPCGILCLVTDEGASWPPTTA